MGLCILLRNSILIACSCRTIRFLIVLRPMTNEPHLRDRVQKCVKPRKSKVSGFPSPRSSRCLAACRPKRISRVLSGCKASSNARIRSLQVVRGTPSPHAHARSRRSCHPHSGPRSCLRMPLSGASDGPTDRTRSAGRRSPGLVRSPPLAERHAHSVSRVHLRRCRLSATSLMRRRMRLSAIRCSRKRRIQEWAMASKKPRISASSTQFTCLL